MSNAITRIDQQQGLTKQQDGGFTREQMDILKNTIAKGSTDAEFGIFVQTCNRLGLDPFARQIFLVKRWDSQVKANVATPQVSIDGFRLVAERTRQYRGQTAPQWCGEDGQWTDVWLKKDPPAAARVGVYREGFAEPLVRVARYASYVQTTKDQQSGEQRPNSMWQRMPDVMLAKCAESLALRAAFPNELSGVYTSEEMGEQPVVQVKAGKPRRTLDDVAEAEARAARQAQDAAEAGADPETGEVAGDYTSEMHADALAQQETVEQLQQWLSMLDKFELSDREKAVAWGMFKRRCADLEIDFKQFAKK